MRRGLPGPARSNIEPAGPRPHKPSWTNEEAFAWLRRMARSKFDEDCVDALLFNANKVR